MRRPVARSLGSAVAAAGALGWYAVAVEPRAYHLRCLDVAVLPPGRGPLRVLHVSDLHMTARQRGKQRWVAALAGLAPDLVAVTGDSLAGADAVPAVLDAFGPLFAFPGVFVPGNNDFYAPVLRNPLRYLGEPDRDLEHGPPLPWRQLYAAMAARGWHDLTNRRRTLWVAGLRIDAAGVDDPYLRRDRYGAVAAPVDSRADLGLGLSHVPEPRVLDRFAADGFALVLCGHTHGGQVRIPGLGAVVTNCGIDRARARWLSRYRPAGPAAAPTAGRAGGSTGLWLHVSAGVGASPYAPIRFACPPEASLLTLVGRDAG